MRTAGAFFIPILDRTAIAGTLITAVVIILAIIPVVAGITTNRVESTIPLNRLFERDRHSSDQAEIRLEHIA